MPGDDIKLFEIMNYCIKELCDVLRLFSVRGHPDPRHIAELTEEFYPYHAPNLTDAFLSMTGIHPETS